MTRSITPKANETSDYSRVSRGKSYPLWLKPLANRLTAAKVSAIQIGTASGQRFTIGEPTPGVIDPFIHIKNAKAILKGLLGGTTGWAEGYMAGDWDTQDITAITDWALHNEAKLNNVLQPGLVRRWMDRIQHRRNSNSLKGSRRNIAYHYDLGNDFYQPWLDETMSYSSALFAHAEQSLAEAQRNKYEAILSLADPKDNAHILEIGCGWGGFAETVAHHPEMSLHGVTLSQEQLAWSQQRIKNLNADSRVNLEYCDYRHLEGSYDNIVSIEMFEAVGEEHWDTYFQSLYKHLKPGGSAVLQIICIDPKRFESYRKKADFIQKYIFPGGMLPTTTAIEALSTKHQMSLEATVSFGEDYASTLSIWHQDFDKHWQQLSKMGFDERFKQMWKFYLAYCESGFRYKTLDVCLFKIRKST